MTIWYYGVVKGLGDVKTDNRAQRNTRREAAAGKKNQKRPCGKRGRRCVFPPCGSVRLSWTNTKFLRSRVWLPASILVCLHPQKTPQTKTFLFPLIGLLFSGGYCWRTTPRRLKKKINKYKKYKKSSKQARSFYMFFTEATDGGGNKRLLKSAGWNRDRLVAALKSQHC